MLCGIFSYFHTLIVQVTLKQKWDRSHNCTSFPQVPESQLPHSARCPGLCLGSNFSQQRLCLLPSLGSGDQPCPVSMGRGGVSGSWTWPELTMVCGQEWLPAMSEQSIAVRRDLACNPGPTRTLPSDLEQGPEPFPRLSFLIYLWEK